jgi:peptidyl-tRNA hydrolase
MNSALCLVLVAPLTFSEASLQPGSGVGPCSDTFHIAPIFDNNTVVHDDVGLAPSIVPVFVVFIFMVANQAGV